MKKQVIRIGDRVKIINNRWIKRVGYPIIWTEIADEVAKDPRVRAAYNMLVQPQATAPAMAVGGTMAIGGILQPTSQVTEMKLWDPWDQWATDYSKGDRYARDFLRVVSMMRVAEMGFGGNKRSIFYYKTRTDKAGLFWQDGDEVADYTGQVLEVFEKKVCKTGQRYPASGGQSFWSDEYDYEPAGLADAKTHVLLRTHAGWIEEVDVKLIKPGDGAWTWHDSKRLNPKLCTLPLAAES